MDEARSTVAQAGSMIMRMRPKDSHTTLMVIEHALAESMYIKDIGAVIQAGARQFINLHQILIELDLDKVHPAHNAFLLALIRS